MNPSSQASTSSLQSVQMSHSQTVLVQNLNPRTQDSDVHSFFSNKRRNSGGPVSEVERLNSTSALVCFKNPLDAKAVVDKGSHVLDNFPLNVCLLFSPASKESGSSPPHCQEMNVASKHELSSTGAKQTAHHVPANKATSSGQQAPFLSRNKVIQVKGLSPSAYKDTIGEVPLVDKRQKFLENVADIVLDTPAINIAVGKALNTLGNTALNVQPMAKKTIRAADNAWVDVTLQLAFVSPPRSNLPQEGIKDQVEAHGCSPASAVPDSKSIPHRSQDHTECLQEPACCSSETMYPVNHRNMTTDTPQPQLKKRSKRVSCSQLEEQEAAERGLAQAQSEQTSSAHSSSVPLQKRSAAVSSSCSDTHLFSESLKKRSLSGCSGTKVTNKSSPSGRTCASEQKVQETTIKLGAEVISKLVQDKSKLRGLVRSLSEIKGRYRWRHPDRIVVTATTITVPDDWKEQVARLMEREREQVHSC